MAFDCIAYREKPKNPYLTFSMKILLVEDETKLGQVLLVLLKKMEYDAVYVESCQEALEILQTSAIDLLITDVMLPGMTGIELVEKLRQNERFADLPILMISGKALPDDIAKAVQLDISGFLAKPFKPKDLQGKIQEISKRHSRRLSNRVIEQIWNERTTLLNDTTGPLIVFGELANSLEEIQHPHNREMAAYLRRAYRAISTTNAAHPDLALGYVIENDTEKILRFLRKHLKDRLMLVLLSMQCPGKPISTARLMTADEEDKFPVFLICDRIEDLSADQRHTLSKLNIKPIKRSAFSQDKFQELIDQYNPERIEETPQIILEEVPAKQGLHDRIVKDVETMTFLPPLPQVYQKILDLSKNAESDLKDWSSIIRLDPMTCATIIRHANSLSYEFEGHIADIDRVVDLLGKKAVADLVAGESMKKAFTAVQGHGFKIEDFWLHSLAVGHAAHILSHPLDGQAVDSPQSEPLSALGLSADAESLLRSVNLSRRLRLNYSEENPYLGGMMHDIGKIAMVHSHPGFFPLLLKELEENQWKQPMLTAEQKVAEYLTHTAVGGILARNWGLGKALENVALHHHQPDISDTFSFLISLADLIGQMLYPFPGHAEYPLAEAIEANKLSSVSNFLPPFFFDQPLCSSEEFVSIAKAIAPNVKDYTEKMRLAIED